MSDPGGVQLVSGRGPVVATVCVCTHRRPAGLERLLQSLARLEGPPAFDVVVVDNDSAGSARAVTDTFSTSLAITYAIEPVRSLAAVRNRAIQLARGEFLAFVDDDEFTEPSWLATLHAGIEKAGAAAAFGPVRVCFGAGVPEPVRCCRFFVYPEFAEGQEISWLYTRTSNAYVRRAALPDGPDYFPCAFGRTGGEDIAFFKKIADAGGRFVHAGPSAALTEFRERARANWNWALRRSLRNGGNMADLQWAGFPRGKRISLALASLRTAVRHAAQAVGHRGKNPLQCLERSIDAAENAGRCLSVLGYRYHEYGSRS